MPPMTDELAVNQFIEDQLRKQNPNPDPSPNVQSMPEGIRNILKQYGAKPVPGTGGNGFVIECDNVEEAKSKTQKIKDAIDNIKPKVDLERLQQQVRKLFDPKSEPSDMKDAVETIASQLDSTAEQRDEIKRIVKAKMAEIDSRPHNGTEKIVLRAYKGNPSSIELIIKGWLGDHIDKNDSDFICEDLHLQNDSRLSADHIAKKRMLNRFKYHVSGYVCSVLVINGYADDSFFSSQALPTSMALAKFLDEIDSIDLSLSYKEINDIIGEKMLVLQKMGGFR